MTVTTTSSTAEEVADRIKEAILSGVYAPGQRLIEAELCQAYETSRGNVRSALIDLTSAGLIERVANKGARVRVVTVEEAVQITEVRMVVEGLCARKAAEQATDADIDALRSIGTAMQEAVGRGEVATYSELNATLHESISRLAGQPVAAEVLTNLRARNVRHQFRLSLRPGRPQVSLPQHLALIDALCSRDPDAAEAAARAHVGSVIEALKDPAGPA